LSGARANVELPILRDELLAKGFDDDDISTVFDPRSGRVTEAWVRWQPRPHFYFSAADDRHYLIERQNGRLIFGDGQNGRVPPAGANNIRARRYRAGGGMSGNVGPDTITQLLGVAPFVSEVTNPRAAEGGADGELVTEVKERGPQTIRHRGRSVTAQDFEAMAREASPGVAVARALPTTATNGRPAPGWVTIVIVPQSLEPQPQPSFTLRQLVKNYLAARAPGTLIASRLNVIGPTYYPVGVTAYVSPRISGEAGLVRQRLVEAATEFLHPLHGGPQGKGWPFGRDVYLSDLAAVLEAVAGVDYVEELSLMLNDTPQGERVQVPSDRIVAVGTIRIEVKVPE
jgi:predicted phage baseplate assembly protein